MSTKPHLILDLEIRQYIATFPRHWRDDLRQEALVALLERQPQASGTPESSEERILRLRRAVLRAFQRLTHLVDPLPLRSHRRVYRLLRDRQDLLACRDAAAIADEIGAQVATVRHVILFLQTIKTGDFLESAKALESREDPHPIEGYAEVDIEALVVQLDEREQLIIRQRYLTPTPRSQAAIAADLKIHQTRLHQLEKRALQRLKGHLEAA
jgi:DNA-directed RNA polymerase specialized sigma subunit